MHSQRLLFAAFLVSGILAMSSATEPSPPALVERIAFGSCIREPNGPVWKAVLRDDPDAFILLGDNVYADTEDMGKMRADYARLDAAPGFARLRKRVPLLGTWDDHDYGVNDGGAEYPRRVESQHALLDFLREPADSPRRAREGVYDAKVWGPPGRRVQIILLDTRYFRSPLRREEGIGLMPDPDTSKTMLGASQWAWLEEQLLRPAEVRLIASSIQVIAGEHRFEKWLNLPHERERLFRLIRTTGATGVIFLSGDRHLAELSQADMNVGYPLFDLTSSPLAAGVRDGMPQEPNRHRVAGMSWGTNYGMVVIDWESKDPLIRLEIRDAEGDIAIRRKLNLSDLRPYVIDRLPLRLWGRPLFGSR